MNFRIELSSYLERSYDDYPKPCEKARLVDSQGQPGEDGEPVYEVDVDTLEELMELAAEVEHPIEIDGRKITVMDKYY